MNIEFRDLKKQYNMYKSEIDHAIAEVLAKGVYIGGESVKLLENELAEYVGVKHCITCANGTDALTLVLMAWGLKEGDAVFVPDFTFFATAEAPALLGATPVFVDVDEQTFNMDPSKLEAEILKVLAEGNLNPRVIIPVDLFGLPANYPEIEKIASKYNLLVLEDGAQGFGGSIDGRRACSFGHAATTSFFPAKPLGCYGDGGAIFTNDDELAELLNSLKVHGKGQDKYDNIRLGVNSRLDTIQAAILRVKLKAFKSHELVDVNKIAEFYNDKLKGLFELPYIPDGFYSSYAQYTIKFENKTQRDSAQQFLKSKNIPTMIYYVKNMSEQSIFIYDSSGETKTNTLNDRVLSLPIHPYLCEDEVNTITKTLNLFLK